MAAAFLELPAHAHDPEGLQRGDELRHGRVGVGLSLATYRSRGLRTVSDLSATCHHDWTLPVLARLNSPRPRSRYRDDVSCGAVFLAIPDP